MANINFDGYGGVPPRFTGAQVQRLIHLTGAACSLALVLGLGVWGYKMAQREVIGVPVFRSPEVPLRIAPANPGGNVVSHQGMAVNVIAAAAGQGIGPEQITLAPAVPSLAPEDVAGLSPLLADGQEAAQPMLSPLAAQASLDRPPSEEFGDDFASREMPVIPVAPVIAPETLKNIPGQPPVKSLFPRHRSSSLLAPIPDVMPEPAPLPIKEIELGQLKAGERLVQLGAFDSAEIARSEWTRLQRRFGDLMVGKSMVVQSAVSGGRTFYRLRAHGFGGPDDSRRFCAALQAENAACIPATHR